VGFFFGQSIQKSMSNEGSFIVRLNAQARGAVSDGVINTPNIRWAPYQYDHVVSIRGAGISFVTPQVASDAALYYIKYYEDLMALSEPWMRVEAIRKALKDSARSEIIGKDDKDQKLRFVRR
jgi:hypothetical protein